jgi:hypothetical protein
MTNKEKALEIQHNDPCCIWNNGCPNVRNGAMKMAQWKDEQAKQLLIDKTKLLSSSAAQDSVKRCTIEEIYRELFNEEMPNSNPYKNERRI